MQWQHCEDAELFKHGSTSLPTQDCQTQSLYSSKPRGKLTLSNSRRPPPRLVAPVKPRMNRSIPSLSLTIKGSAYRVGHSFTTQGHGRRTLLRGTPHVLKLELHGPHRSIQPRQRVAMQVPFTQKRTPMPCRILLTWPSWLPCTRCLWLQALLAG